ncbi:MAG: EAL domain-containing protein [Pelomonas sp.]|nr:EAL domain-containing protein [Burkholderiaceae bacterium]MBV8604570.1 EAL domain-containing protein [Roseateles sp.]
MPSFGTLESRIVTLFLALILAGQGVAFFVIRNGITTNEQAAVRDQLELGVPLFRRLLEEKTQSYTGNARTVAKDYGFRQAIASHDRETIEAVLVNTQERIGASLALYIALDGQIVASTTKQAPGSLEQSILNLQDAAERDDGTAGVTLFSGHPYQIVVVPVRAPITIGYVAMAFALDKQLAAEMRELSMLDVSFLVSMEGNRWAVDGSTLDAEDAQKLADQLTMGGEKINGKAEDARPLELQSLQLSRGEYSTRVLALADGGDSQRAIVVLQRSIDEAIAPYRQLQLRLIVITAVVTVIASMFSFFAARRIASPLRDLTAVAKRLGDGDFQSPVEIKGHDEIRKLSVAFESMRGGIARHEQEIRHLAYSDPLTDLPNRARFAQLLQNAIQQSAGKTRTCFILMMDLNRFKNVNDILGHSFGDHLLRLVAQRLVDTVIHQFVVARLGGDEFAVLMLDTSEDEALEMARRILMALEVPMTLEEQSVDIGAGIGIAGYPFHGTDARSLMSHAEEAMYVAKRGGNEAVVYDPAQDKGSEQNLSLLSEMRRGLERGEFKMYAQPKLSLKTGEFVGFEALVRWQHPTRGLVFPDQFIPFSEKTGFIRPLTRWVLEQSTKVSKALSDKGISAKISVNLSTRDLLDQHLPDLFLALMEKHGVSAGSFCLEITESSIMDDPVRALATLERLHATGVELSIDDFGTGYSSLAYLKSLPVDELKIDKSFVLKMESDASDAKIVRSTIDLAHNLGLRVVAEGVETEKAWALLARMGCDQGQGYFMSRPIPVPQLEPWLAAWNPPVLTA